MNKPTRAMLFKISLISLASASCLITTAAFANPNGATVTSGSAAISSAGSTLTVTNTPNTIINWHNFSINSGEITQFIQQSAASAVLNRITGGNPSQILGTLHSNGRVFLINPSGIIFGAGSVVNVAGLVASTLNITDADFLAGKHIYNANIANPGNVTNAGEIHTPTGGFVYLIGTKVENSGVITTPSGEAILAAGNSVEMVDSTDPSQHVLVSAQSQDVNLSQLMLQNDGNIFGVLNSGRVSANTVTQDATGKIYFKSAGYVQTTSTSINEARGTSELDGGKIISFADTVGVYAGNFDASGKNGGFIETSGHYLSVSGIDLHANALDPLGLAGTWLLDPYNITINTSSTTNGGFGGGNPDTFTASGTSNLLNTDIETVLNTGTSVIITTAGAGSDAGNIAINADIISTYTDNHSLTLRADGDITLNALISGTLLDVNMDAGRNTLTGGNISFGSGANINTTGYVNLRARFDATQALGGNIFAGSGMITAANVFLRAGKDVSAVVSTPVITVEASGDIDIIAKTSVTRADLSDIFSEAQVPANSVSLELQADPAPLAIINLYGNSVSLTSPNDLTLTGASIYANTGAGGFSFTVDGDLTLNFGLSPPLCTLCTIRPSVVSMESAVPAELIITANNLTMDTSNIDTSIDCAGCNLTINADSLSLQGNFGTGGEIVSDNNLTINAGTGAVTADTFDIEGGISGSTTAITKVTSGSLSLTDSAIFGDSGKVIIDTGALTLDIGGLFGSQIYSAITDIKASSLTLNSGGFIGADTDVSITTNSISADDLSEIFAMGNLVISNAGTLSLTNGASIQVLGASTTINTGSLFMDTDGLISASGNLNLSVAGSFTANNNSNIDVSGNLGLNAGVVSLTDSNIDVGGSAQINVAGALNLNGSQITGAITDIKASSLILNTGGFIAADTDVSITANSISADNLSEILATGNLAIFNTGTFSLANGANIQIFGATASINTGSLFMDGSAIIASGNLNLSVNDSLTLNNSSEISSLGNLNINTGSLTETNSSINNPQFSGSNITLNSNGDIILTGSDIVADKEIRIQVMNGKIYLNTLGLNPSSGESHISTYSNNTIFLYFPTLFSGGFVLDGIEGIFFSPYNPFTGFFTGTNLDILAILNTNLFITYAPAGPITTIIGQNNTNTLATNSYFDAYGPNQTGPGDSSLTYGVIGDPRVFGEVRECS